MASVERFSHNMTRHKASRWQNRECPRVLGIYERRFTHKQGFLTPFCDLKKRRVFDIAKDKSTGELETFLKGLRGRDNVEAVCIDMNCAYRRILKDWFPNARVVADRFHVLRLVNHHFSEVCKSLEEASLACGRGRLMRLLLMRRERLNPLQSKRLLRFLEQKPAIAALYEYMHDLWRSASGKGTKCPRLPEVCCHVTGKNSATARKPLFGAQDAWQYVECLAGKSSQNVPVQQKQRDNRGFSPENETDPTPGLRLQEF